MPNHSERSASLEKPQVTLVGIPRQRNRRAPAPGGADVSPPSSGWLQRISSPTVLVLLGVLILFAVETAAIVAACGWHFYYSLDDPYIHLAVSDQIRHLGYGINPGEAETPSSSVLWPFLLAVTSGTPFHEATPIALTLLSTMLSALLLLRLAHQIVGRDRKWLTVASILTIMLCLNWIGVAFTGLEHSAHIAAALAVGVGLVECARRQSPPWWLYAAIVLNPLLRYEGIAITVGAAAVLAWYGRRRAAALCVAAAAVPLIVFSIVAMRNGLSPLPSSVLVKSGVVTGDEGVLQSVVLFVRTVQPLFVLLVVGLLVLLAMVGLRRATPLHLYALWVVLAHCVAGKFGWLGRYELYVYAAVLPIVVYLAAPAITAAWRERPARRVVAAIAVLVAVSLPYLQVTASTPLASRNVYLQQAQMARFAADYWSGPIAVNDVGLVSYEDKQHYVLDLWGLANQEAREARTANQSNSAAWMDRMAVEHGVTAAVIYTEPRWFPTIPTNWVPVARMWFVGPQVSADGEEVTFFATSKQEAAPLSSALHDFQRQLPSGAHLAFE